MLVSSTDMCQVAWLFLKFHCVYLKHMAWCYEIMSKCHKVVATMKQIPTSINHSCPRFSPAENGPHLLLNKIYQLHCAINYCPGVVQQILRFTHLHTCCFMSLGMFHPSLTHLTLLVILNVLSSSSLIIFDHFSKI